MREDVVVWMEADAAWDRRDPDPRKNYGIHGMVGASGGVQFKVNTGWLLPETVGAPVTYRRGGLGYSKELHSRGASDLFPMPVDLSYHARTPQYDDHPMMMVDCPVIDGPCYYDGSGLNAYPVFDTLLRGGSPAVWRHLATYYGSVFDVEVNLDA